MGLAARISALEQRLDSRGRECGVCKGADDWVVWCEGTGQPRPALRTCEDCGRELTNVIVYKMLDPKDVRREGA